MHRVHLRGIPWRSADLHWAGEDRIEIAAFGILPLVEARARQAGTGDGSSRVLSLARGCAILGS